MNITEAKEVLRIDQANTANDELILSLVEALPSYIEVTTGMPATEQANEPLVNTVSGFILKLWYFADHADDIKLQRTIDSLLKCITLKTTRLTPADSERLNELEERVDQHSELFNTLASAE